MTHARRQYDAVDPDNRLVASELERRWNERLAAAARLEEQIRSLQNEQPRVLCDDERTALLALADDLSGRVQRNPQADFTGGPEGDHCYSGGQPAASRAALAGRRSHAA